MTKVRIKFEEEVRGAKVTRHWIVWSTSVSPVVLGAVKFRPQWRKYVFLPKHDTLYDSDCLSEIATFCFRQTSKWRTEIASRKDAIHTKPSDSSRDGL